MLAMFEHFRPTAADMKEIVDLLHPKGHTFTDGALLYVEMNPRGPPPSASFALPWSTKSLLSPSFFPPRSHTLSHHQQQHRSSITLLAPSEPRLLLALCKRINLLSALQNGGGGRLLRG